MQARGRGPHDAGRRSPAACDVAPIFAPLRLEALVEVVLRRIVTNLPVGVLRGGNAAVQISHLLQRSRAFARAVGAQTGSVSRRKVRREIVEVTQGPRAGQPTDAYLRRRVVDVAQAAQAFQAENDHQQEQKQEYEGQSRPDRLRSPYGVVSHDGRYSLSVSVAAGSLELSRGKILFFLNTAGARVAGVWTCGNVHRPWLSGAGKSFASRTTATQIGRASCRERV